MDSIGNLNTDTRIVKLNKEQVIEVYQKHMLHDFPSSELKPLKLILRGMDKGNYECLGLMQTDTLLGYAVFVRLHNDYLFDYLAIVEEYRNQKYGSAFLKAIAEYYAEADSVIGEVEDPECAKNDNLRMLQERRYQFYLRNGYVDTGVRVKLFGVDFCVIKLAKSNCDNKVDFQVMSNDGGKSNQQENHIQDIEKLYLSHYKAILPRFLYWHNVIIKK